MPNFQRFLPFAFSVASLLGCIIFSKFYLHQSAQRFAHDFTTQNYVELGSTDTYALAQRLNSLSSSISWECIVGSKNGSVFFEKRTGKCEPDYTSEIVIIHGQVDERLEILFKIGLPSEIAIASLAFAVLQIFLLLSLSRSARADERAKNEGVSNLGKLAAEVAHDIRSPLAALETALSDSDRLAEETRLLLKSAIARIRDIANALIEKNQAVSKYLTPKIDLGQSVSVSLAAVMEEILSEKRSELSSRHIRISEHLDATAHSIFVQMNPKSFQRIVSNLINNSAEATATHIVVRLSLKDENAVVIIGDNGEGIPNEIISDIGVRGFSYGKRTGSGLGLYTAKKSLAENNGSLEFVSNQKTGTTVTVRLPATDAPPWFLKSMEITEGSEIIVVDDDPSIHQLWAHRFGAMPHLSANLKIIDCYCVEDFKAFLDQTKDAPNENRIYLFDHNLGRGTQSGIEIIAAEQLHKNSVLVTSHADDAEIQSACVMLGIKMIPKSLAAFIPISHR